MGSYHLASVVSTSLDCVDLLHEQAILVSQEQGAVDQIKLDNEDINKNTRDLKNAKAKSC